MTTFRTWKRRIAFLATALSAILALSACGGGDGGSAPSNAESPATGEGYPITVTHAFGETTIPAEPQRIVALTNAEAETLLALGITPVGIGNAYGFENGVGPWAEDLLDDSSPTLWDGWDINFEGVASLEPDLILNVFSDGEEQSYQRLSEIAPTVALPEGAGPFGTTMEQITESVAESVGRSAEGSELLEELDRHVEGLAEEHPEFSDFTIEYFDIPDENVGGYRADRNTNRYLHRLGFQPSEGSLERGEEGHVPIPGELLGEYDVDVVVAYAWGRRLEEVIEEVPGFERLRAFQNEQVLVMEDLLLFQSVLSTEHSTEILAQNLAEILADEQ